MNDGNPNVRKKTVVGNVAKSTGNTQEYTGRVIDSFLSQIIKELAKGRRLEFRDFGIFEPVTRKEKRARNPKTKEEVIVPPRRAVRFRMGKAMRESMND